MEKVRVRVIIEGSVQGVFFRHHTQKMAHQLGVRGWVKNLWNGRVETLIEGDPEPVKQMIQWCHQGPPEATVTKVHLHWEDYTGEFENFFVSY